MYRGESDMRLCDENCNKCPIIDHPNSRLLSKILNELFVELGERVYDIVQKNCPNFTVCYDCRIDDFCHAKGCKIMEEIFNEKAMQSRGKTK